MTKTLNVIGVLKVKPGHMEAVKSILQVLAQETRKEPGNIEYLVIEDIANPNTVFSIEKWASPDHEAKHWEASHLKEAFAQLGPHLAAEAIVNKGYDLATGTAQTS
ncbi:putative quinol monooxygenase [Pontibacter sp. G13]|uniref:putative quinol monooxygenase n=1 Tax=Pontibacter sp. G13 TaxID=3074898 RepID=UPI002889968E|nr:putative quinol monooxygenase [Pontibacter sp. G13]WNJ19097.1 putative quinol monooxygenase [Pontibacter sp. G13]